MRAIGVSYGCGSRRELEVAGVYATVERNSQGIVGKIIPANRCALARHVGPRSRNGAAIGLF